MRAKGTLAALCVLLGSALMHVPAEASEREARVTTPTQVRSAQPATAVLTTPAQRRAQAATRATATRATATRAAATRAAATRAVATRPAATARQQGTTSTQRRPVIQQVVLSIPRGQSRPAIALGAGTPILPVSITSGLSCVPFARMATGMTIQGDARLWWGRAAGTYARGNTPERGSVLAFTASGRMQRGHVAVVSRLVGPRTIHIDHSNWGGPGIRRGTVMRGVVVIDASDRNDWTAVRVQTGHDSSQFGQIFPTHGFIYNRPVGTRMMTAEAPRPTQVAEYISPHAAQYQRLTEQLLLP